MIAVNCYLCLNVRAYTTAPMKIGQPIRTTRDSSVIVEIGKQLRFVNLSSLAIFPIALIGIPTGNFLDSNNSLSFVLLAEANNKFKKFQKEGCNSFKTV